LDPSEAVQEAYEAYYGRMVSHLFALTGNLAEAQDVVQEAFARVLIRPQGFLTADDPERWLRVVALNVARSRHRRERLFTRLVRTGRVTPAPESVPGLTPDRLALIAALRLLPLPTRAVLVLHHVADLPLEEVGATLNVPVGTVKARLSRGRTALARLLTEGGDAVPEITEARHA
jgi:RNA polymerase sigma factor (sigma-70 family)